MHHTVTLVALLLLAFSVESYAQNHRDGVLKIIHSHCGAEWPNDTGMRSFCEDRQLDSVGEITRLTESDGGIHEEAFATIFGRCMNGWPENFEMMAHCLNQQIETYKEEEENPQRDIISADDERTIKAYCERDWPGDVFFCEEQQRRGIWSLKVRPADVRESRWNRLRSYCRSEWEEDYQMQAYCVERELNRGTRYLNP